MKKKVTFFVAALAALMVLPAGLPAQTAPASAPAQQAPSDPSVLLYRKLAQKVRSEIKRQPDLVVYNTKPLTLTNCLAIALRNNGKLLIAREKMLASKLRYYEARKGLLPSMKVIGHMREGLLTSKTFKGEDYKVEGSYDILDGQRKFQSLEQAKQSYILAKKTYEKLKGDILHQTRQVYYQLGRTNALYQEQWALYQKAQALSVKAKEMMDKKILRPVDYLGLVGSSQEINSQLLAANQELTLSRLALCQLLQFYPDNPIQIEPLADFKVLEKVDLDKCLTLAFRHRPDVALAILTNNLYKIGVDLAKSSTGLNVSGTGHFGHKGEAFNEAQEGIQTRPDMKLALKTSLPIEKHTLKYEPDFVKEVPNVGSTTSTVYNSHNFIFELFNNTRERQILEARIAYHDNLEDLESLKKAVVSDIAKRFMDLERARLGMETAQLSYELAQEKAKVTMAGAGETAVGPDDELRSALGIAFAKRRVIDSKTGYLNEVNDLNRSLGIDNYYDPFRGVFTTPPDASFRKIKKVWEFWKEDAIEQDNGLLPTKFYDDYLPGATSKK